MNEKVWGDWKDRLNCKLINTCLLKWKKMVLKWLQQSLGWREWQGLTQTLSLIAWGLRPWNTKTMNQTMSCQVDPLSRGTPGGSHYKRLWSCKSVLPTQPYQKHPSSSEKLSRNHGDSFILIYFGLWLINSLPVSCDIGVFWYHEPFLLLHTPSFPFTLHVWLCPFLRSSLVGPPFLQELLLGGTGIIFALRPEDKKFFLK